MYSRNVEIYIFKIVANIFLKMRTGDCTIKTNYGIESQYRIDVQNHIVKSMYKFQMVYLYIYNYRYSISNYFKINEVGKDLE